VITNNKNKTKRTCPFPGCGKKIPNRKGVKQSSFCETHKGLKDLRWTHQTAWGVMTLRQIGEWSLP
jgi:hypothetical protein